MSDRTQANDTSPDPAALLTEIAAENAVLALETDRGRYGFTWYNLGDGRAIECWRGGRFCLREGVVQDDIPFEREITRAEAVALIAAHKREVTA